LVIDPRRSASPELRAVCVLNRSEAPVKVSPTWEQLGLRGNAYAVRDLWAHQDLGTMKDGLSHEVDTHAVLVVRLKPLS
jgi:alpha-galactosidase